MKTTIEINGKLYDARTGKVITGVSSSTPQKSDNIVSKNGTAMDGVTRRKSAGTTTVLKPTKNPVIKKPLASQGKQYAQDIKRPKPTHPSHSNYHSAVHSAQKSQTLNRKIVKKPQTEEKPKLHSKSNTPLSSLHSRVEHSATGRGMLLKKVPESRLTRAMIAPKSMLVSKFGASSSKKPMLSPHLKVQAEPSSKSTFASNEPKLKQPVNQLGGDHKPIKRSVFEDHLYKANSVNQKTAKKDSRKKRLLRKLKVSPKAISISAGMLAIMLLSGFFAYQNVPSISMRIAASRAGFNGRLPSSVPAGFTFEGPIQAEPNNIVLTYKSHDDEQGFIIQQKPTNWSSESLLTNYLLDSQFRYQVYRDKGLTVYIYNGGNATWVDKGVWYSVTSPENLLSSEQLLELASSI